MWIMGILIGTDPHIEVIIDINISMYGLPNPNPLKKL